MIIPVTPGEFAALASGQAPPGFHFVNDSEISPPEVLKMLSDLNATIAVDFSPSAWIIVNVAEIVGLCSITKPPEDGEIHVGYGIAPSRQGRGLMTAAIRDLLDWARGDLRVRRISAETTPDNVASQRVLERNGFLQKGHRIDADDGDLICWEIST